MSLMFRRSLRRRCLNSIPRGSGSVVGTALTDRVSSDIWLNQTAQGLGAEQARYLARTMAAWVSRPLRPADGTLEGRAKMVTD